jgi:cell division protein FtsL
VAAERRRLLDRAPGAPAHGRGGRQRRRARLNLQLDHQNQEQTQLHTDNARLRSEISTAAAATRVERLARGELGLVQVQPEDTTYIELAR